MGFLTKSKAQQTAQSSHNRASASVPTFQPNRRFTIFAPNADATSLRIHDQTAPQVPFVLISKHHWYSKNYTISLPSAQGAAMDIGSWTPGYGSRGTSDLSLSLPSPSSIPSKGRPSTTIKVSSDYFFEWKFQEKFVFNGVSYLWKGEGLFSGDNMVLYRDLGAGADAGVVVARFEGKGWKGALSVDERGVDVLVAVLTCAVCLRKKDKKRRESGGGGGG